MHADTQMTGTACVGTGVRALLALVLPFVTEEKELLSWAFKVSRMPSFMKHIIPLRSGETLQDSNLIT